MGYDRGDSFRFHFEPKGIPFGSKSKGKLSPRSYPIQLERKSNTSFFSVEYANEIAPSKLARVHSKFRRGHSDEGAPSFCYLAYSGRHLTPNSTPRRLPSYRLLILLMYFLFILYLIRCTLLDLPSVSSLASMPFLSCYHRRTTARLVTNWPLSRSNF